MGFHGLRGSRLNKLIEIDDNSPSFDFTWRKQGGSFILAAPKAIADQLAAVEGKKIKSRISRTGEIVIEPQKKMRPKMSLAELGEMVSDSIVLDEALSAWESMPPTGKEI